MNADGIAAIFAGIGAVLATVAGFVISILKAKQDGQSRRDATSEEHAEEMKELRTLKRQLRALTKQVTQLRRQLEREDMG